jgi:L-iditol 2-dehydrogenase
MKVAVWYNNRDIRLEERPKPQPGPGQALVKVHACGICGSDVVEWYRLPRAPLVQGHEIGGEVVEVGPSVTVWKPGDRVFVAPKVPCLKCRFCHDGHFPICTEIKDRMPGGFAQYLLLPEALVKSGTYLLPDHLSYDQSTFIEPLACVVRAQRLASLKDHHTLLVLGGGMSGLLHLKLAKSRGATVAVTDINPWKLDFALKTGADFVIPADEDVPKRLAGSCGRPADVVILCTSSLSAVKQAWASVDSGGAVVFFAVPAPDKEVPFPINDFWRREIRILTSYYCGPPDIREAMDLLSEKRIEVDDLMTHRLPLDRTADGFRLVQDGGNVIKVIIRPNDGL